MARNAMKFGAHYLPTYVPELDGSVTEFYQKMFSQMEEMDRLGYDHIWVTEHHFAHYGGDLPHPPTFLSAIARTTKRIRLGVAINVLPLHNPIGVAESYAMVDVISNGRLDFGVGKGSEAHEYRKFGIDQKKRPAACTRALKSFASLVGQAGEFQRRVFQIPERARVSQTGAAAPPEILGRLRAQRGQFSLGRQEWISPDDAAVPLS